ncbi:hypothetical protein V8F33_013591 [Rhypophila sp. PSN 637]
MTDPSIGGPSPSGSAAQTPTPGVPNNINQTPVGANTGHETPACSGPSGSKTACGGPDPTYIFNFGSSGPSGSNTGGPGPKFIFKFGGSGTSGSNPGGPGSNFNFGGSGTSNSNTRGRGHSDLNSGRTHQRSAPAKRPADFDPIEEQERRKRRPKDLQYDAPSANILNQRLSQEIFFKRRDNKKGDILCTETIRTWSIGGPSRWQRTGSRPSRVFLAVTRRRLTHSR